MRDSYSKLGAALLIPPGVYAADNTPAKVDLAGFESALLLLSIGAGGITFSGANKIDFVLTHSDDDVTYTNVADKDVIGVSGIANGIIKSLTAAKPAADVSRIGYNGNKRYLKLLADFTGTHGTGTAIDAIVVKGGGRFNPPA